MDGVPDSSKEAVGLSRNWPGWRWALTGFTALALALSIYLGWHHVTGRSVLGCTGDSPCDQVLSSRWSVVGGVLPVSALAAGAYLAMLVASLFIGPATAAADRRLAWGAMLVLAGAIAGSAVWFTVVQTWIIGGFCPYCMATHLAGALIAALVMWRAGTEMGRLPSVGISLVGLGLAGILAACQFAFAPRGAYSGGEAQVSVHAIDPHAVPMVGSPDAPYVLKLLFDYKCPHCQKTHAMLEQAMGRYDGKLAFALCPAPLNPRCNPYVTRDVEEFKDSCELAKIGLAVWLSSREAFATFDKWMFSPEEGRLWHPRRLDAARAKAVELVGRARFDAASADPWIDRYMQTSIEVFGETVGGGNAVPKLVYGSKWVTPEPNDVDDLVSILHGSLGVPLP